MVCRNESWGYRVTLSFPLVRRGADSPASRSLEVFMRYVCVYKLDGTKEWKGGNEPSSKDLSQPPTFIGWERSDWKKEYRANYDKYKDSAEANIKWCEHMSGIDRNDVGRQPQRKKWIGHGY